MARSLSVIAFCLLVSSAAHAEPPASGGTEGCEPAAQSSCVAGRGGASNQATKSDQVPKPDAAPESSAEERAFSAELENFARRRAFTERLVAQRDAELFEQAIARQVRAAKLRRELAQREIALSEREFEDAVALHLKKRELTQELSTAASRARVRSPSAAPAAPTTVPASSPAAP